MHKKRKFNPATKIIFSFILLIFFGTLLLSLPIASRDGQWLSLIDSLFTATSTVCITGLSVVDVGAHFSLFGQIIILLLIQIGGLGFITITCLVFLMVGKKITFKERLTLQESLNQDNTQGVVKMIVYITILVFLSEVLGFICLAPVMINQYGWASGIFKAIFLSVSAFCNAGADNFGTLENPGVSLTGYTQNVLVLLPIMALIIVGGIGFAVLVDIGNRFKGKKVSMHTKITLITTAVLIIGGTVLFALFEWNNNGTIGQLNVGDKILNSMFLSVTPRTAGFSTVDYNQMTAGGIALTCFLMFIGGGSASTAGGIKITTFVCLLLAIFSTPNKNGDVTLCKKRISNQLIRKCVRVVGWALLLIAGSTLLICGIEGGHVNFTQVLFETVSAISTTGISMGITASLHWVSKLIIVMLMFIGRVGTITLTLAMGKKHFDDSQDIQYPDAKIMVG